MVTSRRTALFCFAAGALATGRAGAQNVTIADVEADAYYAATLDLSEKSQAMSAAALARTGTNSVSRDVYLFARLEFAEQAAVVGVLKDAGVDTRLSALTDEDLAEIAKMDALEGVAYERAYLTAQLDAHFEAEEHVRKMSTCYSTDLAVVMSALTKPTIESHIVMIEMILDRL